MHVSNARQGPRAGFRYNSSVPLTDTDISGGAITRFLNSISINNPTGGNITFRMYDGAGLDVVPSQIFYSGGMFDQESDLGLQATSGLFVVASGAGLILRVAGN